MTVRQLLTSIDSAEIAEWIAFDRIEPFGDPRADLRAGIVAAAAANFGFKSRADGHSSSPADFMPFARRYEPDPILLDDPQEQSDLLALTLFHVKFKG